MRFDRSWIVSAALLVLVSKVAAIPEYFGYYIQEVGCTLPDKGYENHGDPVENEEITFSMKNSKGEPVTAWDAGEVYEVSTTQGGGIQFQALILASLGILNVTEVPEGENQRIVGRKMKDCEALWGSYMQRETQTVQWKAPAEVSAAGECVEFSTAQAGSSRARYQVNSMSICSTSADTSSTEADAGSSESETGTGSTGAATDVDSSASETGSGTETTEEPGQQTADTMTADTDSDPAETVSAPAEELGGPGEAAESGPRLQVRGDLDSGNSGSIHLSTALVLAMVSIAAVTIAVYATKDGVRRAWYSHMNYVPA